MEELFSTLLDIMVDMWLCDTSSGTKRSSKRLPKMNLPKPKLSGGVSGESVMVTAGLAGAGIYLWHKYKHPHKEKNTPGSYAEKILSERKQTDNNMPVIK